MYSLNREKNHPPEKIKLRASDLRTGMFVCELDRPWLETPFLFQGFELKTEGDVATVQRYCEHVYIDLSRSRAETILIDAVPPPNSYLNERVFAETVLATETRRTQTVGIVKRMVDEVRFGKSPDVQLAKSVAAECVSRVINDPETTIFVMRMRELGEEITEHAFNACVYSVMLGHQLGVTSTALEDLGAAALLHDIGELSLSPEILHKKGRFNSDERAMMRNHVNLGRDILMSGRNIYSGVVDVAYGHHENTDGSGYPRNLQSHQLNLNTKIVAVTERYDALTRDRNYRPTYNHLDAVRELGEMGKNDKLDVRLTAAFISLLGVYPPGSVVELSSGEIAVVLKSHPKYRLRPTLLVIRDVTGQNIMRPVDLSLKETYGGQPYKIIAVHRAKNLGINLDKYRDAILQWL